jgi:hypothetical protein
MIGTGHHHLAAGGRHGGRDLGRVGGDRHPADFGLLARRSTWTIIGRPRYRAAVCRAGGSPPCGPESAPRSRCSVIGTGQPASEEQAGNNRGLAESRRVYTGCQSRANRYLNPAEGAARKADS